MSWVEREGSCRHVMAWFIENGHLILTGATRIIFPIDDTSKELPITWESHHTNDRDAQTP